MRYSDGLNKILEAVPKIYQLQPIGNILEGILIGVMTLVNSKNAFILIDNMDDLKSNHNSIFKGVGRYNKTIEDFMQMLDSELMEHIGYSRTIRRTERVKGGVILPLINELEQSNGVIYIESNMYEDTLKLLEIYAAQSAGRHFS
jgi:hypothetical protein